MNSEAEKPLRKFLKKVGHDHALMDLWWTGGADAVLGDPSVADEVAALTPLQWALVRI